MGNGTNFVWLKNNCILNTTSIIYIEKETDTKWRVYTHVKSQLIDKDELKEILKCVNLEYNKCG